MKKNTIFAMIGIISLFVIFLMCLSVFKTFKDLKLAKEELDYLVSTNTLYEFKQAQVGNLEDLLKNKIYSVIIPTLFMITSFILARSKEEDITEQLKTQQIQIAFLEKQASRALPTQSSSEEPQSIANNQNPENPKLIDENIHMENDSTVTKKLKTVQERIQENEILIGIPSDACQCVTCSCQGEDKNCCLIYNIKKDEVFYNLIPCENYKKLGD